MISLSKIPEGLWQTKPRNGIYKLYPGKEVEIEGIGLVRNDTKGVIRLVSGSELPKEVAVEYIRKRTRTQTLKERRKEK